MGKRHRGIADKIKCPKCKSAPAYLEEFWVDHSIQFDINDAGEISEVGILCPGVPSHVVAVCDSCEHTWRLRNVSQITELQEKFGVF